MKKYLSFFLLLVTLVLFAGCQSTPTDQPSNDTPNTTDNNKTTSIVEKTNIDNAIDTIVYDIDKDGKDENCVLRYGPTSGVFTFILSVNENGKNEYFNLYHSPTFYYLSFEDIDGTLRLKGMTQGENPKTEYFDFVINGDNITLSSDIQNIEFWGEQGLNSPFAPKEE